MSLVLVVYKAFKEMLVQLARPELKAFKEMLVQLAFKEIKV